MKTRTQMVALHLYSGTGCDVGEAVQQSFYLHHRGNLIKQFLIEIFNITRFFFGVKFCLDFSTVFPLTY